MVAPLTPQLKRDLLTSYARDQPPLRLAEQEFRVTALRPGLGALSLDGIAETVEWTDGSDDPGGDLNDFVVMTGQLTIRRPLDRDITLKNGHVIKLDVQWGGKWTEVWRMRVWDTDESAGSDGTWTLDLSDDMRQLGISRDNWRYKRGKTKRRHGWRYHEIVLDVCRRYGVPVGTLVKGSRRINHLVHHGTSPIDVIKTAVDLERSWSGRKLVITWRDGKLNVLPLRRQASLYELGGQLITADVATERRGDLATSLTARATVRRGKKRTHLKYEYTNPAAKRQFGLIHDQVTFHGIDSRGELRDRAKRSVAKRIVLRPTISATHAGIAFLRRGDAVQVQLPDQGISGAAGIVFCQQITHTVSAGTYTMDLTLNTTDPLDPREVQKAKDKAARLRKAAAKKAKGK